MRTVHDLVNNALNNLQIVRLDLEDMAPPESLHQFDQIIQVTAENLKNLSNLECATEIELATGAGIYYQRVETA